MSNSEKSGSPYSDNLEVAVLWKFSVVSLEELASKTRLPIFLVTDGGLFLGVFLFRLVLREIAHW
jgi:hypothetical protein